MSENTKAYKGISPENLESETTNDSLKQISPVNKPAGTNQSTDSNKPLAEANIIIKINFKDKFNTNVAKILVIVNSKSLVKSECLCNYNSKRLDTKLNIQEPWEKFLSGMEYYLGDNTDEKYIEMTNKLKNHLDLLYTAEFISSLTNKINNSSDQNMRNLIAKEAFLKSILEFFGCDEYEFTTFVEPPKSSEETNSHSSNQAFSSSSAYDSNNQFSFITVTPMIDPVNGKRADTLSIGENIFIQQHDSSTAINSEIADILPSNIDNRILFYVRLEDNLMGKLVVSENTLIKNSDNTIDKPVDEDIIKFVVIAGVVAIILITIMLYIL